MTQGRTAPYGSWKSPVGAEVVAAQSFAAGVEDIFLDPVTSKVYFAQKRPEEDGRSAIVDASDRKDVFGREWDARTKVHEYGGAAATVFGDIVYFSHFPDDRVYKTTKGSTPVPVTPFDPVQRFADFTVHPDHPNLIVATVEDHTDSHPARVATYLAFIDANTSTVTKLLTDADFYVCARFSPDGKFLSWQQWNFPDLPWQSSEIFVAPVSVTESGSRLEIGAAVHVAGKHEQIVAQDPSWTGNNSLHLICDISGYLNPWKFTFDPSDLASTGKAAPITAEPIEEEFGFPQWWLSRHGSGALSNHKIAFLSFKNALSKLYIADLNDGTLTEVPTPYAHIQYMHGDGKGHVVALGSPAGALEELMELTLDPSGKPLIKSLSPPAQEHPRLPSSHISLPQYYALKLAPDNRVCHVTYYGPKNPDYDGGLPGEKPPIVVLIHGGPFYMEPAALDWTKQFWTSRGWAHIDVNYGGSSGFGRAYSESLHGQWGVLDINDAHQSVIELDKLGLVDKNRAVIHGGSAGGYAVLQIATSLPTAFAAGSPQYGISDMKKLDEILHKFEYYLCDRLMGGTYEEIPEIWKERSPIYHVHKIKMPMLFLQGKADTIIPAPQMIEIVDTIQTRGQTTELVLFDGEGHGWRQASTVQTVLAKELKACWLAFREIVRR
ncbi:unnamed protein product [Somion occarium]|uniref:Peptidase S9 prolyl oligopeptidase catalytic domain-containing protein n=1 Tax=Somion occarium TaxID=3059160 RepID=A0ABP1CPM6_9APHY